MAADRRSSVERVCRKSLSTCLKSLHVPQVTPYSYGNKITANKNIKSDVGRVHQQPDNDNFYYTYEDSFGL